MQILSAFIFKFKSSGHTTSFCSQHEATHCPGGILRGCSSQEQVDGGGLRGRAEHTIPHFSQKISTFGDREFGMKHHNFQRWWEVDAGERRGNVTWGNLHNNSSLHPPHKNPSIPSSSKHCANKRYFTLQTPKVSQTSQMKFHTQSPKINAR